MRRIAATASLVGLLLMLAASTGWAISARHDSVTGTARHFERAFEQAHQAGA
jgi:hypothetical protein